MEPFTGRGELVALRTVIETGKDRHTCLKVVKEDHLDSLFDLVWEDMGSRLKREMRKEKDAPEIVTCKDCADTNCGRMEDDRVDKNCPSFRPVDSCRNCAKQFMCKNQDPYESPCGDWKESTIDNIIPKDVQASRGHKSDCAVHNMPALPNGPCDCGYADDLKASRKVLRKDPSR